MSLSLHVISFDVPYPANYGGVIDVFHKLRALKQKNVNVILHCYEYGRGVQQKLEQYCEKVYYYKRSSSLVNLFSSKPYIVASRSDQSLLNNLLSDNSPILFEALHSCELLSHPLLKDRFKIYRESNIEHVYYSELAKNEKNIFKKIFYLIEAAKLKKYESQVLYSDLILAVSKKDTDYFKQAYQNVNCIYLPSFHPYDQIVSKEGNGDFVLYHGKLSVNENHEAALFLIENVFSKIKYNVVIAGMDPKEELIRKVSVYQNIEIIKNPDEDKMEALIQNAQINCLYTNQETGLKLKLIHSLFSGRFVVCNQKMLFGTGLENVVKIGNSSTELINKINEFMERTFSALEIERRESHIPFEYQNEQKIELLVKTIKENSKAVIVP